MKDQNRRYRRAVIAFVGIVAVSSAIATAAVGSPGDLDAAFANGGVRTVANMEYTNIARSTSSTGRYFASGTTVERGISRPVVTAFTATGAIDTSFGTNGHQIDTALDTDILYTNVATTAWSSSEGVKRVVYQVAASATAIYVYSYLENGGAVPPGWGDGRRVTLTFPGGHIFRLFDLFADPTGVVITGTGSPQAGQDDHGVVLKIDRDTGAPITSFGSSGRTYVSAGTKTRFTAITPTTDGMCVVGRAYDAAWSPQWRAVVACLTSSGALDTRFGVRGYMTFDLLGTPTLGRSIYWDASTSKIWIAANVCSPAPDCDLGVARLTKTGAFDTTFNGDGKNVIALGDNGSSVNSSKFVRIGTRTYVGGAVWKPGFTSSNAFLFAFLDDGNGDPAFGTNGLRTFTFTASENFEGYNGITTNPGASRLLATGGTTATESIVTQHFP